MWERERSVLLSKRIDILRGRRYRGGGYYTSNSNKDSVEGGTAVLGVLQKDKVLPYYARAANVDFPPSFVKITLTQYSSAVKYAEFSGCS